MLSLPAKMYLFECHVGADGKHLRDTPLDETILVNGPAPGWILPGLWGDASPYGHKVIYL